VRDGSLFVHRESSEGNQSHRAGTAGDRLEVLGRAAGSQSDRRASGREASDPGAAHGHSPGSEHGADPSRLSRFTRRGDRDAVRAYAAEFGAAAPFVWRLWIGEWRTAKEALLDALGWLEAEEIERAETEIRLARVAGKISREEEAEGKKALDVARHLVRRSGGQAPPTNTPPTASS
jgi:hypothetical protein